MKVMTIVGTRPEIIKLSRVMNEIEKHVNHVIVHTGQNYDYELNELFFENLGVRKPDYFLDVAGKSVAYTIGNVISRSDDVMDIEKPDAILLYGDTNSCLSVISAKRRKIPIFHFEAGNRCFDQRVPEELNRKVLDHLSDINIPLTEHARRYLLSEGIKPDTVIKLGSPMKEILHHHLHQIENSDVLARFDLNEGEYFVVSAHREENVDSAENFRDLLDALNAVAKHYRLPVIVSTHPRTRKKLEEIGMEHFNPLIRFLKPLGFFDYNKLQMKARCVISDSGTITEESSILNFPAITIRQAHERPEGMDEGTLIMTGLKSERVLKSIDIVTAQAKESEREFRLVYDYDVDNFSKKVLRVIMSYTDYINRNTWHKVL
ncbi:MAG: UDP-N-acetylglucosamine 2-epimerase (non-hydrolyzing) [Candidatus Cloacimonadaceae bacterium]|nr:UDP-N-acetylglucosamine 2-epimerase (non-hydrolyzing) [Candidatus Cloacimonadaceae bacterium]